MHDDIAIPLLVTTVLASMTRLSGYSTTVDGIVLKWYYDGFVVLANGVLHAPSSALHSRRHHAPRSTHNQGFPYHGYKTLYQIKY